MLVVKLMWHLGRGAMISVSNSLHKTLSWNVRCDLMIIKEQNDWKFHTISNKEGMEDVGSVFKEYFSSHPPFVTLSYTPACRD